MVSGSMKASERAIREPGAGVCGVPGAGVFTCYTTVKMGSCLPSRILVPSATERITRL